MRRAQSRRHKAAYAGHDSVVKVTEVAALLATHETGAVEETQGDGMQGEGPEGREKGRAA